MLRRTTVIKFFTHYFLPVKAALRCCFVILLAATFSISRFPVFANNSRPSANVKETSHLQEVDGLAGSYFKADYPAEPSPAEQEMEFIEEDETPKNTDECFDEWASRSFSRELRYATSLKCRLSHINSMLHNRPVIPFFVLYHSWKGYLS